ncbi:Hypothetical predicted protein [Mytilus galloprovincialis]|uniref:Uncharacterized protein n=1 Tax=Mytilus galloprovincialis TaxID=29158 RepID=A0A8B6GZF9_MYTGA|nr:Hypothetical predicted protein [Mytilus galloprovincialis]
MLSLIRHLSQANRITIAMDEYTGNNGPTYDLVCQMNWKFMAATAVAEPAVAQSTTRVPATETSCSSSSVDVPPVTQPLQSVPQREEEERVTPPVEEPVAVATKPDESLVVLVYHNTRKLVGVTSVASAVAQAREGVRPGRPGGRAHLPGSGADQLSKDGVVASHGRTDSNTQMNHKE